EEDEDAPSSSNPKRYVMPPHFTFKKWLCSTVDLACLLLFAYLFATTSPDSVRSTNLERLEKSTGSLQDFEDFVVSFVIAPFHLPKKNQSPHIVDKSNDKNQCVAHHMT